MIFTILKFEIWPLDVLLAAVKLRRSRGYSLVFFFFLVFLKEKLLSDRKISIK